LEGADVIPQPTLFVSAHAIVYVLSSFSSRIGSSRTRTPVA
jgi:hypothetical protein